MKNLILPLLIAVLGIGGGAGAGLMMQTPPEEAAEHCIPKEEYDLKVAEEAKATDVEYIKLNNQFVIPVITDTRVSSLVVMSLTVEAAIGTKEEIFRREPKVRDALLQVMFDHANLGGFNGNFTTSPKMDALRYKLLVAAQDIIGDVVTDVLVMDVARQDS